MPKDEKVAILDANAPLASVQTLEQLEVLMENHKKQNPVKFAQREANGEFEKLRLQLGGKKSK